MKEKVTLNDNQRTAAEYSGNKHILVLAGAGTGKTSTIIARAAYLIKTGIDPRRILLLTFTRRAAREMTERMSMAIGDAANRITTGTFHYFCLLMIRRMPDKFDAHDFTVIDRDDQNALMKLARTPFVEKGENFPKASALADMYSYSRNTDMEVLKYLNKFTEHDEGTKARILKIFAEYDKRKQQNRYFDFDDILYCFAEKISRDDAIRTRLRSFYDHILVDEMQDTNPLQWRILDGLRDPAKLFCVGDDAQSIYAFRGADFRNVHSFEQRIPDSLVLKLEDNYRSTQEILDISNWLLKQSPLKYNKKLKAQRGTGYTPVICDFFNEFEEAKWISEDLIKRHEAGAPWKDHMVLTRTAWGSRNVEAMMIEKNIPYRFVGGTSFLQSAHVKDLLCLVRASAGVHDELAWIRYLTLWPKIGEVTASRWVSSMKNAKSMEEALNCLSGKLKKDQQNIVEGPRAILQFLDSPIQALSAGSNFLKPVLSEKYDKWFLRQRDFDLLETLAGRYHNLMNFIETYTLDPITAASAARPDDDDAVTLITVHSAKGTESPVCYLIRVEPGMYPHMRTIGKDDEEEEERRILYVAMTRAKNELILTRSEGQINYAYSYAGAEDAYFLSCIPEGHVQQRRHYEKNWTKRKDGNAWK